MSNKDLKIAALEEGISYYKEKSEAWRERHLEDTTKSLALLGESTITIKKLIADNERLAQGWRRESQKLDELREAVMLASVLL